MSVTVIENESTEAATDETVSVEREVGRLESDVEHVEEKVEEVEEQVEAVEEQIEQITEVLEWNQTEKEAIWNRLSQMESELSEVKTAASLALEVIVEEAESEQSENTLSEEVEVDIPPIVEAMEAQETPIQTARGGILQTILFGSQKSR